MNNVFLTNRGTLDYSAAEEYGELKPLTTGNVNLGRRAKLERDIQLQLKHSKPEDIILTVGHPFIIALTVGFMYRMHGKVNLLYHDPAKGRYVLSRDCDFSPQQEIAEGRGQVRCPDCNRVIAYTSDNTYAIAAGPCSLCLAMQEDEDFS